MDRSLRRSGIPLLGDIPQGTHICEFFQTAGDLFAVSLPFFAAGLASNERCMWLYIDPFGKDVSTEAFRRGLPAFEQHLASGALLVEPAEDWLTEHGAFNVPFFTANWDELIADTTKRGFEGLRVAGACFPGLIWDDIREHEQSLDDSIGTLPLIVLCGFLLDATDAVAIIDVAQTHQFAIAQRDGLTSVLETPARRLRQLATRNRQQAAVVALGLRAIRSRDLDALMRDAVTVAAQTLGTGRAMVWQARPEHQDLLHRVHFGWDELPLDATIPTDDGTLAHFIVGSDQPVIIRDAEKDPWYRKSWIMRRYPVSAMVVAVIRGRDQVWGIIGVQSMTPRPFDEDDLRFMESIANLLALAIERDDHERAERREREASETALARLRAIQSITDAALGRLALNDLLHELLARLRDALQIEAAGVVLLDERDILMCRAFTGTRMAIARVPPSLPPWSRLVKDPRPAIIEDYPAETPPEAREWLAEHVGPVQTAMTAPLIVEGKLIGAVIADSMRPRKFTADELEFLRMVAVHVAPAIERGRLLEWVRAGRERLEALSRRLLSVQEEERRRIAIELHDELGQILTAVKINLESIPAQLRDAVDSVDRAMHTTRNLALDLRPAMLDDLGLAAALRWFADRFAQQAHVQMHLAIDDVRTLEPAVTTAIFRVAQEALTNVARHAAAQNVWLELHETSDGVELTVRDDGAGFDVDAARARATQGASLGLVGMEERVSLSGGSFDVRSTTGAGTELRARFPLGAHP